MKLAPVRVFSCKHLLNEKTKQQIRDSDTRQQKEKIETLWEVKITQKQHFKTHQKCFLDFKMLSQNFPETHVSQGTNNSIPLWEKFFNNLVKHICFQARNQGGCTGCVRTSPQAPKVRILILNIQVKACSRLNWSFKLNSAVIFKQNQRMEKAVVYSLGK